MPALSPSMDSGTVVEWKKQIGDSVGENELLCTVQTDKAVVDYTNPFDPGFLAKIYCQNGESAEVSKTIALMVASAGDVAKVANYRPEGAVGASVEAAAPAPGKAEAKTTEDKTHEPPSAPERYGDSLEDTIHSSGPSVVRLANGLSTNVLEAIVPSGKDGRFVKADFIDQPGFDYNDEAPMPKVSPAPSAESAKAQTSAPSANIFDLVLEAGPILKAMDDTKLLKKLISTMSLPAPKKGGQ
ncbi:unnamed protein product [Phytomonas sp. Hart1]|nr:unnamed protein product [Phytomonas sp. Hart1]|eukprot:CCW71804.1 unnamed protein product [Phytomonas sp. isolate Hart1]